ncbi:polyadenylate-specific 3'-exoribonuclease AS [Saccharomonospora halophila]|uniref:polyadenylate-specific 3'-exoribonuclease AS n=1 Tax=Saccharomonospora halophila TaxID=129922 RepID=UPI00037B0CBD|nr:polyadenylate-specific 3'-exoribonuclease AS [Saccharomonospora halophila]
MRFFYDTEFIEDGVTIDLVSIGVVDETGREFYAVSTEFDPAKAGPWVREHVLTKLPPPGDRAWRGRERIRADLLDFFGEPAEGIELWAWLAAYDHVVLAQLWGPMPAMPRTLPRFTRDLRQRWEDLGRPRLPGAPDDAHDALADARHNLERWRVLEQVRQDLTRRRAFPAR